MLGTTSFPLLCLLALLCIINGWTAASQEQTVYGIPNESVVFYLEKQNLENSSVIWKKGSTELNCSLNYTRKCKILDNGAVLLLEKVSQKDEGTYVAKVLDDQSNEHHTKTFLLKLTAIAENILKQTPNVDITCLGDGRSVLSCERHRNDSVHWTLNGRILNEMEVFLDDYSANKITVKKGVNGSFMCHVYKSTYISNSSAILLNCTVADENPWSIYSLSMIASAGGALLLAILISIITCCCCCRFMKKQRQRLVCQEEDGLELALVSTKDTKDPTSQDEAVAEDEKLVSCKTTKDMEQALEEDEFPPPDAFLEQIQMHENEESCKMDDELPSISSMVENMNHAGSDLCHVIPEDEKDENTKIGSKK